MGRILAIDFGMRRCGIAVTDPLQIISQPLDTVDRDSVIDYLKRYFVEETVDSMVLGIPYNLDGTWSETTEAVFDFKGILNKIFPTMTVHEVDERFTSKEAQRIIVQSVKSKKKRRNDKGMIDRVSASLILESYMNKNRVL